MNGNRLIFGFMALVLLAGGIAYWKLTSPPSSQNDAMPVASAKVESEDEKARRRLLGVWQDDYKGKRTMTLNEGCVALSPGPPVAGGLVLIGALPAAIQGAARPPLAFTIQDIANCLSAGGTAVACRVADRSRGGSWHPGRSRSRPRRGVRKA